MISVREATPQDDLRRLWPVFGSSKRINHRQILLAIEDGEVVGGLQAFDAGHDVVFVGELTILDPSRKWRVAAALIEDLIKRLDGNRVEILFHSSNDNFVSMALKSGARIIDTAHVMAIPVAKVKEKMNGRRRRRRG